MKNLLKFLIFSFFVLGSFSFNIAFSMAEGVPDQAQEIPRILQISKPLSRKFSLVIDDFSLMSQAQDVFVEAFHLAEHESKQKLSQDWDSIVQGICKVRRTGKFFYVIKKDQKIVALILFTGGQSVFIDYLAVHPSFNRRGLGQYLIYSIFDQRNSVDEVTLSCLAENEASNAFYQKLGFELVRTKGFYNFYRLTRLYSNE